MVLWLYPFSIICAQSLPVIAAILPETGYASATGSAMRSAIQLSMERHHNDIPAGFNLEFFDNYSNPDSAAAVTKRICGTPNIIGIVGGFPSGCSVETIAIAEQHATPCLILASSDDTLTQGSRQYIFRIAPPSSAYNDGLLSWAANIVGDSRSVALLYEDNNRSAQAFQDVTDGLSERWRGLVISVSFQTGEKDFSDVIEQFGKDQPTLIWIIGSTSDAARFMRQCREQDWSPVAFVLGSVKMVNNRIISLSDGTADYAFAPAVWWKSVPLPGVKEFVHDFEVKTGQSPEYHAAEAYAGIQIMRDAVSRCRDLGRADLRDALLETDMTTVFGSIRFENYGSYTQQNRIRTLALQLLGQQWYPVWPLELAEKNYLYPPPDWRDRERLKKKTPENTNLFFVLFFVLTAFLLYSTTKKRRELQKKINRK